MSESNRPEREVAAKKWINDQESDSDQEVGLVPHNRGYKLKRWGTSEQQFGGNKLRAPKSLSEETELIKAGKKHTVVKKKRKFLEDDISDEEDPYTLINIEDILSPIESPIDIVQRPTLRRILKSKQIDALAGTAMEFIESEKNFNKILCRLSSILHQDDPQYLDLNFENVEKNDDGDNNTLQSPKKEGITTTTTNITAAAAAAAGETSTSSTTTVGGERKGGGEEEKEEEEEEEGQSIHVKDRQSNSTDSVSIKKENHESSDSTDALEVLRHVKELLLENINYSNEYLSRLQGARDKLTKARLQKDALYNELKSQLSDQRRPSNAQRRR